MNINYEYYKIFYYAAKNRSFSRTAKVLLTNQPNITRVIKILEGELGCTLFNRMKNGVTLTPEGEILYEHISKAVELITEGEDEISKANDLQSGTVTISVTETALHGVMLPLLNEFHERYPGIKIKLLNEYHFKYLHYTNSLGTDLTIQLPEDHLWAAGNSVMKNGVEFVANMPTEEIFTAPLKTGINGVVYSAMPLVDSGNIIDKFYFIIRDGKIVEAHAEKGEEFLKAAISVDEGASYFGEVALVPYDSPISNQKILFYNTLFDENASCHLAFGEAYPECIEGGESMTREEVQAHGLNYSLTHVDFMVGTADLSIVGTTHDGREIPVFINGNFAI